MIHEATVGLTDRGFRQIQALRDDYGVIGSALEFMGQRYCLVAKEHAYQDMASVMEALVTELPEDFDFIFYADDEQSYTVFDGDYYREYSARSFGESQVAETTWRELSRIHGANLDDYVRGIERPDTLAGLNRTMGEFA